MADNTPIEWADATWNVVTGCTVVSPGCTNCYAMRLAGTRLKNEPSRQGLTQATKAGPAWTGDIRFNQQWLAQPLRWRRSRHIFVAAHGDLFHEGVAEQWLDQIFAVMALAPRHTFLVLTKRPQRMREYVGGSFGTSPGRIWSRAMTIAQDHKIDLNERHRASQRLIDWPLPNVWLGVSVEDQRRADERIPDLLATPAATRFISAEPLLGTLEISRYLYDGHRCIITGYPAAHPYACGDCDPCLNNSFGFPKPRGLNWVIVGGESGPGARPMHPAWARSLRDQCVAATVPFFFKQWGAFYPIGYPDGASDPAEHLWLKTGKKAAGRLLDGREWSELPT